MFPSPLVSSWITAGACPINLAKPRRPRFNYSELPTPKTSSFSSVSATAPNYSARPQGTRSSYCLCKDRLLHVEPLDFAHLCSFSPRGAGAPGLEIQRKLNRSETFVGSGNPIQWEEYFVSAFETVEFASEARFAQSGAA